MQHYGQLEVWRRSHKLVLELYVCYGLTSQMRRAVSSVPTNIAEGCKRASPKDYAHFLNLAEGSLSETEYLLVLSRDLGYLTPQAAGTYITEASELLRMLHGLRRAVRNASANLASRT